MVMLVLVVVYTVRLDSRALDWWCDDDTALCCVVIEFLTACTLRVTCAVVERMSLSCQEFAEFGQFGADFSSTT